MNNVRFSGSGTAPIVKNLLIINILVWIAQLVFEKQFDLTGKLALWPLRPESMVHALQAMGITDIKEASFKPYQIVTHFFTHDPTGPAHIIFNMFTLWMFGRVLEMVWGSKRFLFFYLACGLGAAALHLAVQYFRCEQIYHLYQQGDREGYMRAVMSIGQAVGASGAIMGVMAAFALSFPNEELLLIPIPIPIKAKWLVLVYVAIDLVGGLGMIKGDNIAHFAHLGGALTGFILVMIWRKNRYRRY